MKIIDRYILTTYLRPLTACLATFTMLYVIIDLTDNMGDFIKGESGLHVVLRYYLLILPAVAIYIVPVSLFLSALYALSRLTKFNELTAMRASGISLRRLVTPFAVMGLLSSFIVLGIHEYAAPWCSFWASQTLRNERDKDKGFNWLVAGPVGYMNEQDHRIWSINSFYMGSNILLGVELMQQRSDGSDLAEIDADRAFWLDQEWWFENLTIQRYGEKGNPIGQPIKKHGVEMSHLTETPETFLSEVKKPENMSAREINRFLKTHSNLSPDTVARLRVNLNTRLAMPFTCLVVTLLGIPFGTHTGRKGAFSGIALGITFFFLFYIVLHISLAMGTGQHIPPVISAWVPNLFFIFIGLILLRRMR